jgi:hypothetical protein
MRIFLVSILNFVLFHCQLSINNKILGNNLVLRLSGTKKIFKIGKKNFNFLIIYDPLIFANNRFSKVRSINSGRDGFMCQSWAKMSKFIPLVSD